MFTLYPAIDLKDGACVRLRQGDMEQSTIFYDDPSEPAKAFAEQGAQWLHLVDLNGAFEGKPVNKEAVQRIIATVDMPIQLGGGIRDLSMIATWLEAGISRVILGTVAVKNPDLVYEACKAFPDKVAVGIDAKGGMVATEGWAEASTISAIDLAHRMEDAGVCAIIYTDIARDGMMQGPNIEETLALAQSTTIPVIASGGIANLHDVTKLAAHVNDGISGAISGRALYDGSLDLKAAIEATQ